MLEELHGILPCFQAAGIPVMLLKGPELASRFHGGLHERGYGDLDLLVHGRDRRATLQLLSTLGYAQRSRVLLSRTLMAQVNHGFDFSRHGVRLDLHWCLSRQPGFRIDEEGFWQRGVGWSVAGLELTVPHPADELHHLLISAFADLQRGALRLQSLLDLKAVMATLHPFEETAFLAAREQERTAAVCRSMLAILRALLPAQGNGAAQARSNEPKLTRSQMLGLLQPAPLGLPLKLWCARRLPVSLPSYGLWWLASLPLRAAASHPALRRPLSSEPAPGCQRG
ncbi:MAG: nucleotidyltransferase family protein [Cyanobacteriota bacterium]|nr:nucleotidyltransferase family protein [Cyanobacteriota bacterium]